MTRKIDREETQSATKERYPEIPVWSQEEQQQRNQLAMEKLRSPYLELELKSPPIVNYKPISIGMEQLHFASVVA